MKKLNIVYFIFVLCCVFNTVDIALKVTDVVSHKIKIVSYSLAFFYFVIGLVLEYENRLMLNRLPKNHGKQLKILMDQNRVGESWKFKISRAFLFGFIWPNYLVVYRPEIVKMLNDFSDVKK